jgi:hypothetical protein
VAGPAAGHVSRTNVRGGGGGGGGLVVVVEENMKQYARKYAE